MLLEHGMDLAREIALLKFGHELGPFDTCGEAGASAECVRPGCNMGLTVRTDTPGFELSVLGSAVAHTCAGRNP